MHYIDVRDSLPPHDDGALYVICYKGEIQLEYQTAIWDSDYKMFMATTTNFWPDQILKWMEIPQ